MRTQRMSGSTTYTYTYDDSTLVRMTVGGNTLIFTYGTSGHPMAVEYNGTSYYYVTNALGDVLAIINESGTEVVTYNYDAWGNVLSTGGTMASTLGKYNPFRYRGYVYDEGLGLYYLQSRYYNPQFCRFLSADAFVSTGQGILGYNMFAYCNNNPVKYVDHLGYFGICVLDDPMNVYRAFMTPGMFGGGGGGNTNSGSSGNPYTPTSGGGGVTNRIRMGKFVIDFGHGGRHLDISNISGLENAIAQDVITRPPTTGYRGEYDVVYDSNIYTYRYWTISATHINVGTYFPKTPTMVEGR